MIDIPKGSMGVMGLLSVMLLPLEGGGLLLLRRLIGVPGQAGGPVSGRRGVAGKTAMMEVHDDDK